MLKVPTRYFYDLSCGKSFTTKFNLKRHINMHCHKSREQGVPIQVGRYTVMSLVDYVTHCHCLNTVI